MSEPYTPDVRRLEDLAVFARVEVESRDVEPWADVLGGFHRAGLVDLEGALWLCALYNSHDSLASTFLSWLRWPSPEAWANAPDRADAALYECTQERRNLRGGRLLRRHAAYVHALGGMSQEAWLRQVCLSSDPAANFRAMTDWMRQVWGVGRQSAFEWAEFAAKVAGLPVDAGDAQLWESEGPRRSLQRLYGNPDPSPGWLDRAAADCKAYLERAGVPLLWWDFETIICDFNVMRDGRYYPGRHHAAVIGELEEIAAADARLGQLVRDVYRAVTPAPWRDLPPGIDRALLPVYRDTGEILTRPWERYA